MAQQPAPRQAVNEFALRMMSRQAHSAEASGLGGWFESSWDLRRGLEVHEGLPDDVRLDDWLAACRNGSALPPDTSTLVP